jgi:hypothetical protein
LTGFPPAILRVHLELGTVEFQRPDEPSQWRRTDMTSLLDLERTRLQWAERKAAAEPPDDGRLARAMGWRG